MSSKKKTAVKAEKVKGITELTMEKHKFEGFNVRVQSKGYAIRKYISSSVSAQGEGTPAARKDKARTQAILARNLLSETLANPKSWRNDAMTKATQKHLVSLGFTVRLPVGVEA